jgi:hypothetical protein
LEFRFEEKLDEAIADGSTLYLHGLHCEFVEKFMASTEGKAQLIPRIRRKNTVTPSPIVQLSISTVSIASIVSFSIALFTKQAQQEDSMPFR